MFKNKYLKYKHKYLDFKNNIIQKGGAQIAKDLEPALIEAARYGHLDQVDDLIKRGQT